MRASATSKPASPANYFASQAKADANKADNDSPFALLVASIAPKDCAKPAMGDASQSPGDDKPDEANPDTQQDSPPANSPLVSLAAPPVSMPAKTEKSGKSKDIETPKTDKDLPAPDGLAALTLSLQQEPQPELQLLPPLATLAQPPAPAVKDDKADELQVGAATPVAAAPVHLEAAPAPAITPPGLNSAIPPVTPRTESAGKSGPASAAPSDKDPEVLSNPKPLASTEPALVTPTPDDKVAKDDDTLHTPVVAQAPVPTPDSTGAGDAAKPDSVGLADQEDVEAPKTHESKSRASSNGVQHAAPHSAAAQAIRTNPGRGAENDIDTTSAPKAHTARTASLGTALKDDASKSDASDAAEPAPSLQQPTIAAAPKASPLPVQSAIDAINAIAAPQAQTSPVAAATPNQHIQVTAHAAPDLPALAVEIAAKSQSGAKQFDIRLDPPELGRVEVRLSIDTAGKASAHLSADQPQTLSLLQKDAPILTRALREAGLDVSQHGLNFSLRQQGENANGNANHAGRRGSARSFSLSASLSIDPTAGSAAYRGPAHGRLDIRV